MLLVVLVVVAVVVTAGWWWLRRSHDVATELDQFAAARAMTSKWAEDPASAPRPVLDIAARKGQPVPDAADDDHRGGAEGRRRTTS